MLMAVLALGSAQAQTYKVIYNFTGGTDGANPWAGLTMDSSGHFYGTTNAGGTAKYGTVYQLKHETTGWILATLYNFTSGLDGAGPYAAVQIGSDGSLYGSTANGGGSSCTFGGEYSGCGTIFNLRHTTSGWKETVLYRFQGGPQDGAEPFGPLAFDAAGNIYGATSFGGANQACGYGYYCGTAFKLTRSGTTWSATILHNFGSTGDGALPYGGVTFDKAGNLYGTAWQQGTNGYGSVFELVPSGSSWTENVLYNFQNGTDGGNPIAGLILDASGNLYGASVDGGPHGGGAAFELSAATGKWMLTALYDFAGSGGTPILCTNCVGPVNDLVMDAAGNLYGTTYATGTSATGAVFKLAHSATGWTYTSLHDFTGGSDGSNPRSALIFDAKGNLYGTTTYGGAHGQGVIFQMVP